MKPTGELDLDSTDNISGNNTEDRPEDAAFAPVDAPTAPADAAEYGTAPHDAEHAASDRPDRPAYVREPARHVSQPPVNDMQADETIESSYTYETGYTLQKRGLGGRGAYRHAQSQQNKIRQELKYGQYLSVPKGSREIFGSRENEHKKKVAIAAVVIIAIAVILLIVFWPK